MVLKKLYSGYGILRSLAKLTIYRLTRKPLTHNLYRFNAKMWKMGKMDTIKNPVMGNYRIEYDRLLLLIYFLHLHVVEFYRC